MTHLNLLAVPANDTQPKSISCNDNKGDTICTIWADGVVSYNNGQDISWNEKQQIDAVCSNFHLFYSNIKANSIDRIKNGAIFL